MSKESDLNNALQILISSTGDYLVAMTRVPNREEMDDAQLTEFWTGPQLENNKFRNAASLWARNSRNFSVECIKKIREISEEGNNEMWSAWEEGQGTHRGSNLDNLMNDHYEELVNLAFSLFKNNLASLDQAKKIFDRLQTFRNDGHDDRKFDNTVRHLLDSNEQTRKSNLATLFRHDYVRINRDKVLELTRQLLLLHDAVLKKEIGSTKLLTLISEYHLKERHPERHGAWFIVQQLNEMPWNSYIENEHLVGKNGLIYALLYDVLATVSGDGGLGKTALVYEFIRRNHLRQTSYGGESISPFEEVVILSTKNEEQGELNTLEPGGGLLDPGDPRLSVREFLNTYNEFETTVCMLSNDNRKISRDSAIEVLKERNVLVVIDNYEDIEKDKKFEEEREKFANFLEEWRKQHLHNPQGRIVMTGRTGLQKFSGMGSVQVSRLSALQSIELLRERFKWLLLRNKTSTRILDDVLDSDSKIFDQVLEEYPDFRDLLWGHPLMINSLAMLLLHEERNADANTTGPIILDRAVSKMNSEHYITDISRYTVKKTVDNLFSDEKNNHMLKILLRHEEMISPSELIGYCDPSLEITYSSVNDFTWNLLNMDWLETSHKAGFQFRLVPRYRTQIIRSEGDDERKDSLDGAIDRHEREEWEKLFIYDSRKLLEDDDVIGTNLDDFKRLETICRLLLGENVPSRITLGDNIRRICTNGLSNRKTLQFENLLLANEIVDKCNQNITLLTGLDEATKKDIVALEYEVYRSILRFICAFSNEKVGGWKSVNEPLDRQIRRIVSRLSKNPDPLGNFIEISNDCLVGLRGISERWHGQGTISRNSQLEEILYIWGDSLSVDENPPLEAKANWLDVVLSLRKHQGAYDFHRLGKLFCLFSLEILGETDLESGVKERTTKELQNLQNQPLFMDYVEESQYPILAKNTEKYYLDEEKEGHYLHKALPGDCIIVPDGQDWELSETGKTRKIPIGDIEIIIDAELEKRTGRLLIKEISPDGYRLVPISDEDGDVVDIPVPMEIIINWCEEFLEKEEGFVWETELGEKLSDHIETPITRFLKGSKKWTTIVDLLKSSSLAPRLAFNYFGPNQVVIGLDVEESNVDTPNEESSQRKKKQEMPNPRDSATCIRMCANYLGKNRVWISAEMIKEVINDLREDEVNTEIRKHRYLMYRVFLTALNTAVKPAFMQISKVDISPRVLLENLWDFEKHSESSLSQEKIVDLKKLGSWKDDVAGHIGSSEVIVNVPEIRWTQPTLDRGKEQNSDRPIEEFRQVLSNLTLPTSGEKSELIDRIAHFYEKEYQSKLDTFRKV